MHVASSLFTLQMETVYHTLVLCMLYLSIFHDDCVACSFQGFDPGHDTYQSPPEEGSKIDVVVDPKRFRGNTSISRNVRDVCFFLFSANVCSS